LIDVAVPLVYDDFIMGYMILGQMKQFRFPEVKEKIGRLGLNMAQMEERNEALTCYERGKIQSVENLACMLAKHILTEQILKPLYHPLKFRKEQQET